MTKRNINRYRKREIIWRDKRVRNYKRVKKKIKIKKMTKKIEREK